MPSESASSENYKIEAEIESITLTADKVTLVVRPRFPVSVGTEKYGVWIGPNKDTEIESRIQKLEGNGCFSIGIPVKIFSSVNLLSIRTRCTLISIDRKEVTELTINS